MPLPHRVWAGIAACLLATCAIIADTSGLVSSSVMTPTQEVGLEVRFPWISPPALTVQIKDARVQVEWPMKLTILNYLALCSYAVMILLVMYVVTKNRPVFWALCTCCAAFLTAILSITAKVMTWAFISSAWVSLTALDGDISSGNLQPQLISESPANCILAVAFSS